MLNLLNAGFQDYILIIVLVVLFGGLMVMYYFRNKKATESENKFLSELKPGDNVKTYSGFYGTVEKITETTDGKVVTLKLGEKTYIDVDARALMGLDVKTEIVDEPVVEEPAVEAPVTEIVEPKVEEVKEEKPAKKVAKKAEANKVEAKEPAKKAVKKPAAKKADKEAK